jgi:hypothetical protein
MSLWWWALPVLLLPVWWHRQRRRQVQATPLATARFLPKAAPRQLRAWRWVDIVLLLLRCLLLTTLIAWLADPVIAWRGDTVLVVPGGVSNEKNAIHVPTQDAVNWLRTREAEWKPDAKITVVGPQSMAATRPRLRHQVDLQTSIVPAAPVVRHVTVVGDHAAAWRAMFAAIDGPVRYVVDAAPGPGSVIWDHPDAPPRDAAAVRALFEAWQRVHYAPAPYVAPPQMLAADPAAPLQRSNGALRDQLLIALIALFALERGLAHVRRR